MILTGTEIGLQVRQSRIVVDPFDERLLNPNSYNYRLGPLLRMSNSQVALPDRSSAWSTIQIPDRGYVLEPGRLYLGHTLERLGSDYFVPSLIGRSSLGRLGLFLQLSCDLGQLGAAHHWTLELTCVQPIRVYPRMPIGQVTFWRPRGKKTMYRGRYAGTSNPTASRLYQDYAAPSSPRLARS